jgi:transcriptional regulator with XRE-family HTH domain
MGLLNFAKIRELREGLRISQSEAARRAGLRAGRQGWQRIESGRRVNIELGTLERIAAALGVDARELLKPRR